MPETTYTRWMKVLHGERPTDRLPTLEWAWWWDKTLERWEGEGLPAGMHEWQIKAYFGLDVDYHHTFTPLHNPPFWPEHGQPFVRNLTEYGAFLPYLYPDPVPFDRAQWRRFGQEQEAGTAIVWFNVNGFFWWPRTLLGIEGHLFAFYDQPELMHRINRDVLAYHRRCIDELCKVCRPIMMNFWEDLSYNHGPMLSRQQFDEFLAPYYRELVPEIKARGIVPWIDSDGQIEPVIPWFEEVGLVGIGPLERMAGVDLNRIRQNHPSWLMFGGFDKTTMPQGDAAMRQEFERILPAMRAGRYVPSVDHQTPPGVSLEQYRVYRRLQDEYAKKAVL